MNIYEELIKPLDKTKEALAGKICKNLLANGYDSALFFHTGTEAAQAALSMISPMSTVGIPGSVTIRQLDLIEKLKRKGCTVYQHWGYDYTYEDKNRQNNSDWFITSSNAITVDGKMVNIDGAGNRVACMAWGKNEIIYIIGMNKITQNIESALSRARNLASPPNARRTGTSTPCARTGHCVDCSLPERICRAVLILERAPFGRKSHVILVGESLGY